MIDMAKGKRISKELIDEIDRLRMSCSPPQIIEIMQGRVSPRSVYRILRRLRLADEERWREDAERLQAALEREEAERIRRARMRGAVRFTNVAQFPARLRKVRAS
jgi:hypothetical protein